MRGAQVELAANILDRVAERACRLERKADLAGNEGLLASLLGQNWQPTFLDHAVEHVDGLLALRPVEGNLALVCTQHVAAGAEEQCGEHPVVALPAEVDALVAVAERLDLCPERDDLVPGLRRAVRVAASFAHQIGIVIHDRVGGGEGKAHLLAADLGELQDVF
ncbi:hypothetical protein D9M70_481480 [compost metagenome]